MGRRRRSDEPFRLLDSSSVEPLQQRHVHRDDRLMAIEAGIRQLLKLH